MNNYSTYNFQDNDLTDNGVTKKDDNYDKHQYTKKSIESFTNVEGFANCGAPWKKGFDICNKRNKVENWMKHWHNKTVFLRTHHGTLMLGYGGHNLSHNSTNFGSWEKFKIKHLGHNLYAFYNLAHKRFLRMHSNGHMDLSNHHGNENLPRNWGWERFRVSEHHGKILIFSDHHKRFVRAHSNKDVDATSKRNDEFNYDGRWTWEKFQLIDAAIPGRPGGWGCYAHVKDCKHNIKKGEWFRDEHGEKHEGARDNKDKCLNKRKSDYDGWCGRGSNNTTMHWKANPNKGKTCLVLPSPINKELCFKQPDVSGMANDITKKVSESVKKDVINPAIEGVKRDVINPIKGVADKAAKGVADLPTKVKREVVNPAIDAVKKDVINPIKGVADTALREVRDMPNKVKRDVVDPAIDGVKRDVINPIKGVADQAIKEVREIPNKVKNDVVDPAIKGVKDKVITPIKNFLVGLINKLKSIFKDIGNFFKNIPNAIKSLGGEFEKLGDKIKGVFETIGNFFENIGGNVLNVVVEILVKVFGLFATIFGAVFDVGKGIVMIFWNIMKGKIWWLQYVPFFFLSYLALPFMVVFILLSFLFIPVLGNWAFLLPFIFIAALPFVLKHFMWQGLQILINTDYKKLFENTLKKSPEIGKKLIKYIVDKIKLAIKNIKLNVGDVGAIKNIKKEIEKFINKIKDFPPFKEIEKTINNLVKAIQKL